MTYRYNCYTISTLKEIETTNEGATKMPRQKTIARMNRRQIIDALLEDGFRIDALDAAEVSKTIQLAARSGALLWSENRIVSTLNNRPLTICKPEPEPKNYNVAIEYKDGSSGFMEFDGLREAQAEFDFYKKQQIEDDWSGIRTVSKNF